MLSLVTDWKGRGDGFLHFRTLVDVLDLDSTIHHIYDSQPPATFKMGTETPLSHSNVAAVLRKA